MFVDAVHVRNCAMSLSLSVNVPISCSPQTYTNILFQNLFQTDNYNAIDTYYRNIPKSYRYLYTNYYADTYILSIPTSIKLEQMLI